MNKTLSLLLPIFVSSAFGSFKYKAETNSRVIFHTNSPVDLASHRHSLELEGTLKEAPFWTFHAGAKAYVEGAYASNTSRFGADVRQRESQDYRLKDVYVQYKSGGWTLRLGNQQLVWGEAFGFYYADIVNPKDLRELGIGPLEKNRISVPMFMTKYVSGNYSVQGFFIPKPYFHLTPADGGDFSFPFNRFFPGIATTHYEQGSGIISSENFEGGVRLNGLIDIVDLSLIFATYLDRSPAYMSNYTSASTADIRDSHERMKTLGVTASVPCGPVICRAELLWHMGRYFNTFQLPDLVPMKSDEYVGVFGIDYTVSDKHHFGLQVSENLRATELPGAISAKSQQNISAHVKLATYQAHRFETLISFLPNDSSFLIQAQYLIPLSERIEWLLTSDTFFGDSSSQFGQYKNASRAGMLLRFFLGE